MVMTGVPPWSAVIPTKGVTSDKLADGSVGSQQLADGGVLAIDLGDGQILPVKVGAGFYGGNGAALTVSRSDHSHTKADVGLGNVDNTADTAKPVSTAQSAAIASAVSGLAVASAVTSALALKADIASPTFTGTVAGISKAMVGLGNVDNTSDASKPVSTATSTALSGKAATVHTHAGADINSGTVPIARLPTGATSSTLATGERGMPTGGSTGATLKKNTGTDYDVTWGAVRTAVINYATSSSTTAQASGAVDYVSTSLVLPNDGNYLVIAFGYYTMEGTTTAAGGDFQLKPTIGASVQTYPTTRGEQGVDTAMSGMHSVVVAGNQTVTVKLTIQWIAGNIGPKGGAIHAVAIPI